MGIVKMELRLRGNEKRNRTAQLFEFIYKVEAVVHVCIPGI
jgi:hypothetical protein